MEKNTVILVTDERQRGIGEFLPGTSNILHWRDEADEDAVLKKLRAANVVILPTPAKKLDASEDLVELLKYNLINCKYLFGGVLGEMWYKLGDAAGFACHDFMKDEQVALENARITAQAAIAEIAAHSRYEISGQKIIVTGYGRCARVLANMLSALGGKVTVLARSAENRKTAKTDGHNAVDFSYAPEEAYGTRIVVNTVPAPVVTERMFRELHPDTLVVDIASAPGGCDTEAAKKYGIFVLPALGLPSKYMTKSSAKVFADAIYKKAFLDFNRKEDKAWISQIII